MEDYVDNMVAGGKRILHDVFAENYRINLKNESAIEYIGTRLQRSQYGRPNRPLVYSDCLRLTLNANKLLLLSLLPFAIWLENH